MKTDQNNAIAKYMELASEHSMIDSRIITPKDIVFDIRAIMKCLWGCQNHCQENTKCDSRSTTYLERMEMIKSYQHILMVHSHDARELSVALLKLERTAFLDGYYFAFTLRSCNLCKSCNIEKGEQCRTPDKVRPCEQMFGINVYKTARNLGFPCEVLQNKDDVQNRYGFLLID
jgi:predicted metal-binding protein